MDRVSGGAGRGAQNYSSNIHVNLDCNFSRSRTTIRFAKYYTKSSRYLSRTYLFSGSCLRRMKTSITSLLLSTLLPGFYPPIYELCGFTMIINVTFICSTHCPPRRHRDQAVEATPCFSLPPPCLLFPADS